MYSYFKNDILSNSEHNLIDYIHFFFHQHRDKQYFKAIIFRCMKKRTINFIGFRLVVSFSIVKFFLIRIIN